MSAKKQTPKQTPKPSKSSIEKLKAAEAPPRKPSVAKPNTKK